MMLFNTLLLVFLCLLSVHAQGQDGEDRGTANSAKTQIRELYQVLHDVALPSADVGQDDKVEQRLVLLLPGKILSYDDYFPGSAYVNSLRNEDPEARFVDIEPRIMENMFRLSDVVPGLNPFNGFETGESLSAIYRDIVGLLDIEGFKQIGSEKKKQLKESINYLVKKVPDPQPPNNCENFTVLPPDCLEITRLSLYRRYEKRYFEEKEKLETLVESQRQSLTSLEYQIWFSRTYPVLLSKVEGAFVDWLVFGDKDNIELYRSRLDTSSPGTVLLEAKSALRSSEFSSLDRSQKIYPVNFVPGDWYTYISNVPIRMSREQLQNKIADLESQRLVLAQSLVNAKCSLDEAEVTANSTDDQNTQALIELVAMSNSFKCACLKAKNDKPDVPSQNLTDCVDYQEKLAEVEIAAENKGFSLSQVLQLQSAVQGEDTASITETSARIQEEIDDLQAQLPLAPGSVPDIAGFTGTPVDPNDKWLTFSYNSKTSLEKRSSDSSSSTYSSYSSSYRSSGSYSWWWWWGRYRGGSSSSSSTKSSSSRSARSKLFSSITGSEINVKGRLLRVTIQRPWFRPDIFRNRVFKLVDPNLKVSPGPMSEKDFIERAREYRMPQYVTGLLLARDIEMEFKGINQETSQEIVRSSYQSYSSSSSSSSSYGAGWGCFSFSRSSDYSSSSSSSQRSSASFQASSTASGMKIRIPGAQVIGYYTQVVPKFPVEA